MYKQALLSVLKFLLVRASIFLVGCAGLSGDSVQNEAGQPFNAEQLPCSREVAKVLCRDCGAT